MSRRTTNRALTAGAAVLALALAGCGGGDDPEPSSASTSATAGASESAEASESPAEGTGEGDAAVGDVIADSIEKGKTAHVTIEMEGQMSGEGDMSFTSGEPAMDMTMTMSGQEVRMIMVGGIVYMGMPGSEGKFMKIDPAQAGMTAGIDPSQMLEQLRSMEGGEDLGDGHYRYVQGGATTDLYVGDDDLLERIEVDTGSGKVLMTYSDWGKDVSIEAPPAADVTEMPAQ